MAYEIASVTTSPAKVRLRGPADRVSALQRVVTESVSLDDRKESFDVPNVAVIVGDTKVEVIDSTVSVHVEIVREEGHQECSNAWHFGIAINCKLETSLAHWMDARNEMTKLFGTDGIRGEAGKFPLDAATVETIGASLVTHLKNKLGRPPLIVIGRDTRESGEWLEHALLSGIASVGGKSKTAGIITTPGVAFLARTLPADAGIVISASHNPYRDNGIKIFSPSGRKLDEATERLIEADVSANEPQLKKDHVTRLESDNGENQDVAGQLESGMSSICKTKSGVDSRWMEFDW